MILMMIGLCYNIKKNLIRGWENKYNKIIIINIDATVLAIIEYRIFW